MGKLLLLAVASLVMLSGCGGVLDGEAPAEEISPTAHQPDGSETRSTTLDPTDETETKWQTPYSSGHTVGSRAIAAETDRIHSVGSERDEFEFVTDEIVRSEFAVIERNETGAIVHVRVSHSGNVDCESGESYHFDGARTETRYFVTEDSVRLIRVNKPVYPIYADYCS